MDSEMPYFLVTMHQAPSTCIMRYTVCPCLVSLLCNFYTLSNFSFSYLLLTVTIIECNKTLFFTWIIILRVNEKFHKLERVYRDCIKRTRDKTRIYSIPHDAPGA